MGKFIGSAIFLTKNLIAINILSKSHLCNKIPQWRGSEFVRLGALAQRPQSIGVFSFRKEIQHIVVVSVSYQRLKQVGFLVRPALPGCRSKLRSYRLSSGVSFRGSHGSLGHNMAAAMAAAIAAAFDILVMDNITNRALPLANVQRYWDPDSQNRSSRMDTNGWLFPLG